MQGSPGQSLKFLEGVEDVGVLLSRLGGHIVQLLRICQFYNQADMAFECRMVYALEI